jgi:DNA-binding GntR family transcriptional regulator
MSITSYIKNDVIAGISSGQLAPGPITLNELSERYQVSLTPVRVAVRELISEGFIQQSDNRRLVIQFDRSNTESAIEKVEKPEQPKDIYEILIDDLVRLSLKGKPVLLREEPTARKYGVTRAVIRPIFNRLAGQGVLKYLPRRGWKLRPFQQADLDAYIEMRVVLEVKAMELAWSRLVDEDLRSFIDGHHLPESSDDVPRIDNSFHDYLIGKANNRYLADFFERHDRYFKFVFEWEIVDRHAAIETVHQHLAILQALLRRDRPAAESALVKHIRYNHPSLQKLARAMDEKSVTSNGQEF